MEAIVLAGGLGTRLRAVLPDLPKPMAPIGGTPFLELLLRYLAGQGIERAVLALGYRADAVRAHFGARLGKLELDFEVEPAALGTGGAVRRALRRCCHDPVLVCNGDTFLEFDGAALRRDWQQFRQPLIVVREVPDRARFGSVAVADGVVSAFNEKGLSGPGLVNAGCYLLRRDMLDAFPEDAAFSLESDFLAHAVGSGEFRAFVARGRFIDIGIPDDYARAQSELREERPRDDA